MTIQIHLKDNSVLEFVVHNPAYLHQLLSGPHGFITLDKNGKTMLIFKHMIKWITY